jgi:hypothetical protein
LKAPSAVNTNSKLIGGIVFEFEYKDENNLAISNNATTPLPVESQPYDKHFFKNP